MLESLLTYPVRFNGMPGGINIRLKDCTVNTLQHAIEAIVCCQWVVTAIRERRRGPFSTVRTDAFLRHYTLDLTYTVNGDTLIQGGNDAKRLLCSRDSMW